MSSTDNELMDEIMNYMTVHNCTLISTLDKPAKRHIIEYICGCGKTRKQKIGDMLRRNCRWCGDKKITEIPTDFSVCPDEDPDEKWVSIKGGFISNKNRVVDFLGNNCTIYSDGRVRIAGETVGLNQLLVKGLKKENCDLLTGRNSHYVARKNEETVYVGTREEIGKENGIKAHQSVRFNEMIKLDIEEYKKKYNYIIVKELPYHLIFEDGNIYSNRAKRFLAFSKSDDSRFKTYYSFQTTKTNYYKVHRLVCYAFHPIEGKTCLKDYDGIVPNHKNGDTLNNHKDNLEWTTQSENMKDAYNTGLNKKVREVEQYVKNEDGTKGDKIASFISLAEASRQTGVREHTIREFARNKSRNGEFFWKYANEEQNEEFSKKFSSRR
jgi:hypothetical protein